MTQQRCAPGFDTVPDCYRDGRLHAGMPHQAIVPKRLFKLIQLGDDIGQSGFEACHYRLQPDHQARVDDVLAGRSEMHGTRDALTEQIRAIAG